MKKATLLVLLIFASYAIIARNIKSNGTGGGNFNLSATWQGGTIPNITGDSVEILGGDVITVTSPNWPAWAKLQVDLGGTLTISNKIDLWGTITNNGAINGGGYLYIQNALTNGGGNVIINGTGTWIGFAGLIFLASNTITITSTMVTGGANVYFANLYNANNPIVVDNQGTFTSRNIGNFGASSGNTWTNDINSNLSLSAPSFSGDILNASANGNTCTFGSNTTVNVPSASTYYNLTINGSPALAGSLILLNNFLITSGAHLNFVNFSMTVGGNWTNNGNGLLNMATVTFNGSTVQDVGGTSGTTFKGPVIINSGADVVCTALNDLNDNITVNSNATLDIENFPLTENTAGKTFTLGANSNLIIGKVTSANNTPFPAGFIAANISLDPTSTVTYQANGAETVSSIPTYGNVIIATGASASTKTPSGTPVTIAGNLTINSNTTLSQTTNSINLTGNLTDNGNLTFTSGNLSINGNFTNNGTATNTANTVSLNGSAGQTVGGTSSTTFNNLTATGNGGETVTLGNNQTITANLLISGGTLDVSASNYSLTIGGNLTNNGTLNGRSGLITMNGSTGQVISGSGAISFYDLTLSGLGAETVSLNANESFADVLTINGGNMNGSGVMTLISNAGKTAMIAAIPAGSTISTNFIVQRYDGRTVAAYEALSTPVQSTTLGDWNTSNRSPKFYMSGVGGPDGNAGSYVSVYLYNEPSSAYQPITNFATPGISYNLVPAQGVFLWMGQNLSSATPYSFITHGVPNQGNVTYNVTDASVTGFNIVGNPYPSPIDWTKFKTDNPSLQSSYYLWEEAGGNWTAIGSGSIPMEQGFGVKATSAVTLTFKESHKTLLDASLLRSVNGNGDPRTEDNAATFTLSSDANHYYSPTVITFGSDYTTDYNSQEDASFMKSFIDEAPQLYTISTDKQNLYLNRLPENTNTLDVPLTAIANVAGNYTLTATNISKLTSYSCVSLVDKESGVVLNNFMDNPTYAYAVSQPGTEKDFILRFVKLSSGESCNTVSSTSAVNTEAGNISIYNTTYGALISFNLSQTENAVISAYNLMGQKLTEDVRINAYKNNFTLNLPSAEQVYIVRVITDSGITTKKLFH